MKNLIYPLLLLVGLCAHTLPATADTSQPSTVSLSLTETLQATELSLSVALENPTDSNLTAFQMDINLPTGLSLTAGTPTASVRLPDHQIMLSTVDGHTLRIVAFSPSATAIPLTTGELFTINLTSATPVAAGDYTVTATDITLSSRDGTSKTIADASGTLTASQAVATYTLTYIVNGEVYTTQTYAYGATITPPATPELEGHTFNGWTDLPETMPAADTQVSAAFTVNNYTLTYIVNGEVYTTQTYAYGATITPPATPELEGHTFNGWTDLPETMPAADTQVSAAFTVNNYTLTYIVNGEVYTTQTYAYGATITLPAAPKLTGHTFNGWTNLPETMPAADTQVSASFSVNTYTITYYLDGNVYTTQSYAYGATITPPEVTVGEGREFTGWQLLPETMPASNLTIYGYTRTTGIDATATTPDTNAKIYDLSGRLVTTSSRLPHGVYIRGGKRVIMGGK
ncbi:MAG: InlB B-repeat-containing protein [Alloprevotella sp.]